MLSHFPPISLTSYHNAAVMHWLRGHFSYHKGAAVKILWEVADRTFGHRKWEDVIALSQFADACGIGRDTVLAVLANLLDIGLLHRRPVGNSYAYHLVIPENLFSDHTNSEEEHTVDNALTLLHKEASIISFFCPKSSDFSPNRGVVSWTIQLSDK